MGIENNASEDAAEQLRKLEARVRSWKKWVSGLAVCLIGAYLIYFGLILGQNPATDSDKWGAFGDFIGGVMNPIVAFAAFFWLTESVKIQKQELADTRQELSKATEAQNELVENGRESVKLAALTALLNVNTNKIDLLYKQIDILDNQVAEARRDRRAAMDLQQRQYGRTISTVYFASQEDAVVKDRQALLANIRDLEFKGEALQGQLEAALSSVAS